MRDDIHRRLTLPRAWKRVVKTCMRDAEQPLRSPALEQAARSELRELRPTFVEHVCEALANTQTALFPAETFRMSLVPSSPIEAAVVLEAAALSDARLPTDAAIATAMERALGQRVGAVEREIRAQLGTDFPGDCRELVARFSQARFSVDLGKLVRAYLAGESIVPAPKRSLDLDSDLRGQP